MNINGPIDLRKEIDSIFNEYNLIKSKINSAKRNSSFLPNKNKNQYQYQYQMKINNYKNYNQPYLNDNNFPLTKNSNNKVIEEFKTVLRNAQNINNNIHFNNNENYIYNNDFNNFDHI